MKINNITLEDHNQRASIYTWDNPYQALHILSNQTQWRDSPLRHHREGVRKLHQWSICHEKNHILVEKELPLPIQKQRLVSEASTTLWTPYLKIVPYETAWKTTFAFCILYMQKNVVGPIGVSSCSFIENNIGRNYFHI